MLQAPRADRLGVLLARLAVFAQRHLPDTSLANIGIPNLARTADGLAREVEFANGFDRHRDRAGIELPYLKPKRRARILIIRLSWRAALCICGPAGGTGVPATAP
jgi:hypothetical protein